MTVSCGACAGNMLTVHTLACSMQAESGWAQGLPPSDIVLSPLVSHCMTKGAHFCG